MGLRPVRVTKRTTTTLRGNNGGGTVAGESTAAAFCQLCDCARRVFAQDPCRTTRNDLNEDNNDAGAPLMLARLVRQKVPVSGDVYIIKGSCSS
jgi:hypothetical protein